MSAQQENPRKILRAELRAARRALPQSEQQQAAKQLSRYIDALSPKVQNVALYLANDGEIAPELAIASCRENGIDVYLPIVSPNNPGHLAFQLFTEQTALVNNQYGIPEPIFTAADIISINALDIVFMPLVGFDHQGNRLGMGGGYYDRTLAPLKSSNKGPILIGLAHDCQQVATLPTEDWDVPLHMVLTPSQKIITKHGEKFPKLPL